MKYDRIFKEKAVLLSYEGDNISQVAKELEIHPKLLNKWRKEYKKFGDGSFPGSGHVQLTPNRERIHDLEKKLKELDIKFNILKNGINYLLHGKQMIFRYIESNEKIYSIKQMCEILDLDIRTYRRWKNQSVSEKQKRKILIKEEITIIFFTAKQRYGSARITIELQNRDYKISRTTVSKYMKELDLHCQIKKYNVKVIAQ
jgi:putative transposase